MGNYQCLQKLGAQLYTVREKLASDPENTVQQIADMGFHQVELYDVGLLSTLAPLIAQAGLELTSVHFWPAYITGRWDILESFGMPVPENTSFDKMLEQLARLQISYAVMPMLFPDERGDLDHYKKLGETFNQYGQQCHEAGVQFCYHNHSFELEPMNGSNPLETLFSSTDPRLVSFELDVFWTAISGADPIEIIHNYADRIKILHFKDLKAGTPPSYRTIETAFQTPEVFVPLGQGVLDFPGILKAADTAGIDNCMVELDFTQGDPFEELQISLDHLKSL